MLENIDAVIFDLDGTLIDSMWVWKSLDDIYIEKYNIVQPDDFHSVMEGMSYTEVATYFRDEFKLPMTVEEIKKEWQDMTLEMYHNDVQLKDGVREMLAHLEANNIQIGLATSSSIEHVEAVLEGRGIRHYFATLSTSCAVNAGKPAPDVYLKAASDMGVEPCRCLAFEDVPKGVMAGKNAGMKVCAVEDKGNIKQRQQLRELADYYTSTFHNVLQNTYEVM